MWCHGIQSSYVYACGQRRVHRHSSGMGHAIVQVLSSRRMNVDQAGLHSRAMHGAKQNSPYSGKKVQVSFQMRWKDIQLVHQKCRALLLVQVECHWFVELTPYLDLCPRMPRVFRSLKTCVQTFVETCASMVDTYGIDLCTDTCVVEQYQKRVHPRVYEHVTRHVFRYMCILMSMDM